MKPRHGRVLEALAGGEEVSVQSLAARLGVAAITIRRDLDALEAEGLVTRTHGGAALMARASVQFAFVERAREQTAQKQAIAREAARFVKPGMTVALDTGTTTLEVARAIGTVRDLRVLTTSLAIASELYARANIELILLGGLVRRNSPDLSGPLTEENLSRFRTQLAIVGADALDPSGVYTTDLGVAQVTTTMMAGAEAALLVADSSKFARRALVRFAKWGQVSAIVTDAELPPAAREWVGAAIADARYAAL